jgi:hypothetical protein
MNYKLIKISLKLNYELIENIKINWNFLSKKEFRLNYES